ncbi:protein-glutamate O-methyltransferase CheR [Paenibacillus sp. PL2-23]|uniref:CheR family methyltransferase n=1 Tax=Paenibacillus sp. PL2-23 TaxID=2100729 RepID=UPI0030F7F966
MSHSDWNEDQALPAFSNISENGEWLDEPEQTNAIEELEIDLLLEAIYRVRGYDFRKYLRSSLRRRIRNRMGQDKLRTISALQEKLLHEEGYIEKLLEDFSIKVTEMFRDPTFFLAFRENVVPELRKLKELRIWHAGCATGEEVYSMAILLQEEGLLERATLYATDMSPEAIAQAKEGKFPLKRMQSYTRNYLQAGGTQEFSAYYTTDHSHAYFHADMKRHMMFAQHNLATDGSFNEFHVILCRNVLIYFDTNLQARVHSVLCDSLSSDGFLALGSKESLLSPLKANFREYMPEERIFRKAKPVERP